MNYIYIFRSVLVLLCSVTLASCATSSVGYENEKYGNDPVSSKEYCTANCAAFAKDGSCLRHTEGSARVCKDFRTPKEQSSNLDNFPESGVRPLALEICQALPRNDNLSLMVSSIGKGDRDVPTRTRVEFLNALEQQISHDCAPASTVYRSSFGGLFHQQNDSTSGVEALLNKIKDIAAADFLIVPNWRDDGNKFHVSLTALDISAAPLSTVVGQTVEKPVLASRT